MNLFIYKGAQPKILNSYTGFQNSSVWDVLVLQFSEQKEDITLFTAKH